MVSLQVLSMAMAFVGAAWQVENWRGRRLKQDSAYWPTTKGEVVWSDIVVETGPDASGRIATRYGAAIRYRYLLGGRKFESTRITWRQAEKSNRAAAQRKLLARYPVGRAVTVHYDPRQPRDGGVGARESHPAPLRPACGHRLDGVRPDRHGGGDVDGLIQQIKPPFLLPAGGGKVASVFTRAG